MAACDVEAILPLYADDAVFLDVPSGESSRGKVALRSLFEALFSGPDVRFRVTAVRVGEGWGAVEWVWSGRTRTSGVPFEVPGVSLLEIPGPKVTRETIYYDPTPARA